MEPKFEIPKTEKTPPKNAHETGKTVFDFLNKTKFIEMRKSDEKFDEWFKGLSYQEYEDYVTRLNGILRQSPTNKRSVDGQNVQVQASFMTLTQAEYLPPYPEQKDTMMQETFDALKKISNPEDKAMLAYYSLQAIHPYTDGNGRTGRLLYEVFSEDGKNLTENNLSELLDHNSKGHGGVGVGRGTFSKKILPPEKAYVFINRETAKDFLGKDFMQEYGLIYDRCSSESFLSNSVSEKLPEKERKLIDDILCEGSIHGFSFRDLVLTKLMKESPEKFNKYLFPSEVIGGKGASGGAFLEDYGKKMYIFEAEDMMRDLTEDDVKRIFELHKDLKKSFIKNLIDVFENPNNHTLKNSEGKSLPIKSAFNFVE